MGNQILNEILFDDVTKPYLISDNSEDVEPALGYFDRRE